MVLHGQTWSIQEKRLLQEKRVKNWFKNHTRPSTLQGPRKRLFVFKRCDSRKLSDAQRFSKLYYVRRYKKLVTKTWQDFYLAHYERVKEDVAKVDATERDKVVRDSIREDLRAGVLDSVPTKALGAEEDVEDEDITENDEDQEERGGQGTGTRTRTRDPQASPLASRSQRNAVEEHKMKEDGEEMDDSDNEVEVGDGDKRVKRLNRLLSRRSAMEYTVIRLLDQIFKETGFVGTVCLAGPDPHKGGKMMTVSIHKTFTDSPDFAEMYPRYKQAVSDPMRAYSSRFFLSSDRSEWAFPGTEHLYNQQQEGHDLGALYNSIPTPESLPPRHLYLFFPTPHTARSLLHLFQHPFAAAMWDTAFADAMPPEKDTQVEAAALDKAAQVITSTQVLTSATLDTSASPHVSASLYVSASHASLPPLLPHVSPPPRALLLPHPPLQPSKRIFSHSRPPSQSRRPQLLFADLRDMRPLELTLQSLTRLQMPDLPVPSMLPMHLPLFVVLIPPVSEMYSNLIVSDPCSN
ncbi:hypothetical protein BJV77DRAFT_1072601 [Russula vinacea]|nr:hypothetical protein BJV77DRAFT_1072601 [Russula vinacea]